jgi:hypothetical protein
MRRSIVYLAFVTVAMSSVLSSQASAGKSGGPNLYSAGATGKHIKEVTIKARTTTGSPGPKGNVGASPRDASTGQSSGQRNHEQLRNH